MNNRKRFVAFSLMLCIAAWMLACGRQPEITALATYTAPLKMTDKVYTAYYKQGVIWQVSKWCEDMGIPAPAPGKVRTGCRIPKDDPLNKMGVDIIYYTTPADWNDFNALANMGHELGHGLGGIHEALPQASDVAALRQ